MDYSDRVTLLKLDGRRFDDVEADVQSPTIFIPHAQLPLEEGDRILRTLLNGTVEVFAVEDPGFLSFGRNEGEFQAKVRRERQLPDAGAVEAFAASLGAASVAPTGAGRGRGSRRVFVVHGHDDGAKETVARVLGQLDLEPVILHERPNQGRTIIEKIEQYADVAFAVVILSPDDVGAAKADRRKLRDRARQNVILELGYFIGLLGRANVCALHLADIELPSDTSGLLYVAMDQRGAWKMELGRELRAAGIEVDLNRLSARG